MKMVSIEILINRRYQTVQFENGRFGYVDTFRSNWVMGAGMALTTAIDWAHRLNQRHYMGF